MAISHLPTAFTYPVITAEQARAAGISAGSLAATAAWNERRGGQRRCFARRSFARQLSIHHHPRRPRSTGAER